VRCSSCEIVLDRYVEGTLPPRQMAAVSSHLKACDPCSSLLRELRVVDALMATTAPAELPPNFTFAVMAEVRATPLVSPRRIPPWALLAAYLAAAWIAILAVSLGTGRSGVVHEIVRSVAGAGSTAFGALAGLASGVGPVAPAAAGIAALVLSIDALLIGAFIYFYRSLRPRLVAALARPEAS
jgi:anti-sigma factor RsiW